MEKGNKKVFKGGKEEESVFASTFDKLRLKREADESERAAIQTKAEIETAERLVMESEVTESDDAKAARVRSKLDRARLQKITIMELMRIEEEEWLEEERKRIEKEKLMAKHRAKIDVKDRVIAFYREHNPAKLSDIDNILNKYKGKELELLEKLHIQYNVPMDEALRSKPATPEKPLRDRIYKFYCIHNPDKLDEVDKIIAKYKGNEDALIEKLKNQYNVSTI